MEGRATSSDAVAYRVPFAVERHSNRIVLKNRSTEKAHSVSFTLHGSGLMGISAPTTLAPGEAVDVTLAGTDLARNSILVVRWFRADGTEYLWRLSF